MDNLHNHMSLNAIVSLIGRITFCDSYPIMPHHSNTLAHCEVIMNVMKPCQNLALQFLSFEKLSTYLIINSIHYLCCYPRLAQCGLHTTGWCKSRGTVLFLSSVKTEMTDTMEIALKILPQHLLNQKYICFVKYLFH